MKIGMLWYDNDPRTGVINKIRHAAEHYRQKYGCDPDMCLFYPSMLAGSHSLGEQRVGRVIIRPNQAILPGHLWIGIEDQN